MSKNHLQEFCQRNSYPLPVYTTVESRDGLLPCFKSKVEISKLARYQGKEIFSTKKLAEQDVASKLLKILLDEDTPLSSELNSQVKPDVPRIENLSSPRKAKATIPKTERRNSHSRNRESSSSRQNSDKPNLYIDLDQSVHIIPIVVKNRHKFGKIIGFANHGLRDKLITMKLPKEIVVRFTDTIPNLSDGYLMYEIYKDVLVHGAKDLMLITKDAFSQYVSHILLREHDINLKIIQSVSQLMDELALLS